MKSKAFLVLVLTMVLSGCGISQTDYDQVVKERDALQQQVNEQSEALSNIEERLSLLEEHVSDALEKTETEAENDDIEPDTTESVEQAENSESVTSGDSVTADDISIIKEYTLNDSIGWYSRHFMIIQNNSSVTADVSCSSLAYDTDGNLVGTDDAEVSGIGSGCTSILVEAIETDKVIDHYETTLKAKESNFESVLQDLSPEITDIGNGIVVQVTNSGSDPAEFVQGIAIFLQNDEIVGYEENYIVNDEGQIPPGETLSKQFTPDIKYESYEFFMTGRGKFNW